jgi:hypothetical protein
VYPWDYYHVTLPAMAQRAGKAWASDFARLSNEEQRTIIVRAVVGAIRYQARKAGKPEPMIVEAVLKPLPGGGYEVDVEKPHRPLRPEWGGKRPDGTIAIPYTVAVDNMRNNPAAIADAQRLAAQLAGEAKPKRKARSR